MSESLLHLPAAMLPGETRSQHSLREKALNTPARHVPESKLFADLVKRQCVTVMRDITACPPDTIPAHIARLDGLRELLRFMVAHTHKETPEARPSGAQLTHPYTLADYLACLEVTRKQHRAPCFVNATEAELTAIRRGIDMLAGLLSIHPLHNQILDMAGGEA